MARRSSRAVATCLTLPRRGTATRWAGSACHPSRYHSRSQETGRGAHRPPHAGSHKQTCHRSDLTPVVKFCRCRPSDLLSLVPSMSCPQGRVIMFYSMKPNGDLDPLSAHGSCGVKDGVKWAANKWVRQPVIERGRSAHSEATRQQGSRSIPHEAQRPLVGQHQDERQLIEVDSRSRACRTSKRLERGADSHDMACVMLCRSGTSRSATSSRGWRHEQTRRTEAYKKGAKLLDCVERKPCRTERQTNVPGEKDST